MVDAHHDSLRTVVAALLKGCSPTTTRIEPDARLLTLCPTHQRVDSLVGVALLFCELPAVSTEAYWYAWAVLGSELERVVTVADLARFYERARDEYTKADSLEHSSAAPILLPSPDSLQHTYQKEGPLRPAVGPGWAIGGAHTRTKWLESDVWSASVHDPAGALPASQYIALCAGAGGQGAGSVLTGRLFAFLSGKDSPLHYACTATNLLHASHAYARTLVPRTLQAHASMACIRAIAGRIELAHAGNIRVYRVSGGHWARLNTEHTVYRYLLEHMPEGGGGPESLKGRLPMTAVTSALGPSEDLRTESLVVDLSPGDTLVFCTPSVWSALDEKTLPPLPAYSPPAVAASVLAEAEVTDGAVVVATYSGV